MIFYDFNDAPYSVKHGYYGGLAGDKDGVEINGEKWLIKFPKTTKFLQGNTGLSYTTSPLSEYIGSHIYQMLGFETHETRLGKRNGKVVVACKDFCGPGEILYEMKTIKNAANKNLSEKLEMELCDSATGDAVNLKEIMLHMDYNPLLQKVPECRERFWDMSIVDIFIENNDRNSGNWGLLVNQETNEMKLAPVYDNGNSFESKTDDLQLLKKIYKKDVNEYTASRTAFYYNEHILSAKKFLKLDMEDLRDAIIRMVPVIEQEMPNIQKFIQEIPSSKDGYDICSDVRKQSYILGMEFRLNSLLIPAYRKILEHEKRDIEDFLQDAKEKLERENASPSVSRPNISQEH